VNEVVLEATRFYFVLEGLDLLTIPPIMSVLAKYCSVCGLAFPTTQGLLNHSAQAHKGKTSRVLTRSLASIEEWFLTTSAKLISTPELKTNSLLVSPKFQPNVREMCSQSPEMLVITTDPSTETVLVPAPKPTQPVKSQEPSSLMIRCPIKRCLREVPFHELDTHFKHKHTLSCRFEGCSYTHYNLIFFISHFRNVHSTDELPTKRPRPLDEEASAYEFACS
jgi:hypothetical protein